MKIFTAAIYLFALTLFSIGCDQAVETEPKPVDAVTTTASVDTDHDHDDHKHDDHDHGDHDHEGHDHGDHDHGDHAELTVRDVLASLREQSASIEKAYADGNPDDIHDTLHSIGDTIANLEVAAKNEGLEGDDMTQIMEATEDLMNDFGSLDEGMHGGEKIEYSEVKEDIEEAFQTVDDLIN